MVFHESGKDIFSYYIADLKFCLDLSGSGLLFSPPKCLEKFQQPALPRIFGISDSAHEQITIKVIDAVDFPHQPPPGLPSISSGWQFWKTTEDRFVFFDQDQRPVLQLIVDPDFSRGEVVGNFSIFPEANGYPLNSLDIRLLSAWLASFGDVLLHASGVIVDGRGYCFAGDSGAGKSTLAAQLARFTGATIIGEDQIVLRYLDDRFWMYGTPWHMSEEMCSPERAPLEKLFFICNNDPEGVRRITGVDGVTRLLQTGFIPYHLQEYVPRILDRLVLLSDQVPFNSLSYCLGSDPWPLIQSA